MGATDFPELCTSRTKGPEENYGGGPTLEARIKIILTISHLFFFYSNMWRLRVTITQTITIVPP